MASLENISISFLEPNGDGIMSYDVNGAISAAVPNVGDTVYVEVEGLWREVSSRSFMYLPNTRAIQVSIYLKEV